MFYNNSAPNKYPLQQGTKKSAALKKRYYFETGDLTEAAQECRANQENTTQENQAETHDESNIFIKK